MKVAELIAELKKANGESRVFMGYDGNIVVTEPASVITPTKEEELRDSWWEVEPGDTIILCTR